ncbi:MAG: hypothetical protein N838_00410 [Thiohalocapsa sp. PB-PSB1]|nr:MAG: hypothetical protein N838_00410 [Thiohalocapsa sp. PB-PSB1]
MFAGRRDCALLDGMRQFVGEKVASGTGLRLILPTSEEDMRPLRKSAGVHLSGNLGGFGIVMNPYLTEIGAETRLEVLARFFIQGATTALH